VTIHQRNPERVRHDGGAQAPLQGGGLYLGYITAMTKGRASINVPALGVSFTNIDTIGGTPALSLKINDSVIFAFLENDIYESVIIGRINISADVYPTLAQFNALVSRVAYLESNDHVH